MIGKVNPIKFTGRQWTGAKVSAMCSFQVLAAAYRIIWSLWMLLLLMPKWSALQ